jgi:hypothetical protein
LNRQLLFTYSSILRSCSKVVGCLVFIMFFIRFSAQEMVKSSKSMSAGEETRRISLFAPL